MSNGTRRFLIETTDQRRVVEAIGKRLSRRLTVFVIGGNEHLNRSLQMLCPPLQKDADNLLHFTRQQAQCQVDKH